MIAGICLAAAVPMVILANLMYLKCVRQRWRAKLGGFDFTKRLHFH